MLNTVLAQKMKERSENEDTDVGMYGRTVCLVAQGGQRVETGANATAESTEFRGDQEQVLRLHKSKMGAAAELEVDERQELAVLAEGHSVCWPTSNTAKEEQ